MMRRLLSVAVATLLCSAAWAAEGPKTPSPAPVPSVSVMQAVTKEIVERAVVTGTLVSREEIFVAPELEGPRITEILVEEGEAVAKGQVLARLSRDLLETELAQNSASLARAEAAIAQANSQIIQAEAAQVEATQALERTRALIRGGNTTEVQLEQRVSAARAAEGRLAAAKDGLRIADAEKRAAEAQSREIQVRLGRTDIKAPQDGIIARKNAKIGATASSAGDPLFRIIAKGEIELEGEVTETQLVRIHEGAPAQVMIDRGRTIEGRVRIISPEVDRTTRLGRVRIALPRDSALRIGAFARGSVEVARETGLTVPLSAILYDAKGPTVQVVVNDHVQTRRVRTGLSAQGAAQIEEGVVSGEAVIARAGSFLRDGDAVRPVIVEATRAEGAL
ncbi:efflux RND transporter periplasmic adaptor subunit [Microvirga puerhi]|uniref:Efflux RND transporter periplasmic adaptor subunit n=1 Tax=Microvirga puerhi TaxID=2876078 RepID=A0ABS7VTC4_9HYPH|nr:efflux RND transporter periplasmic adaptor subunit [Microvirga puerhi]MBZ6078814.1 efflux RND transporter periplasmic adaptor subunit [Microvirga puerhi]